MGWLGGGGGLGSFDQFPVLEDGSGPHEGNQVGGVDGPPSGLCHVHELVGHRDSGSSAAGAFGEAGRNRTGANVDSIGFVVRRGTQCSAG